MSRIEIAGVRPDDVLDVIRNRRATGSRNDGHRLGLVVEGGTMRGVYTAGALLGLHAMDMSTLFDDLYGTSAGAVNGAHFLSGLGHLRADTYYRYLADGRFYNPWRLRKVVDIDYFADEVLARSRPIDVDKVMASATRLWVAIADFVTARPLLLHAQGCGYPLLSILKAAVAMPVFYNRLIQLGNVRGFDAGLCNPLPLEQAIGHGCSHVLVLTTHDLNHISVSRPWTQHAVFGTVFARGNRRIMRMFADSHMLSNRLRDLAAGRQPSAAGRTAIATVYPVPPLVSGTCQSDVVLRSEMIEAARGILALLGHATTTLDDWIKSLHI